MLGRRPTRPPRVKSVDKALDLLLLLARSGPLPARDVAQRLGLPRSSAYRFLQTLERRGFAVREGREGFGLGATVLSIVNGSRPRRGLREAALPRMRRLSAEFGESVFLTVEQAGHAVVIEKVAPAVPVRLALDVGQRVPLNAGALGKILLAFGRPGAPERLPRRLPRMSSRTVTDLPRLRR
jgi:DNA-binding IclR family transcriptional regulator